jgi:hypothetical protein
MFTKVRTRLGATIFLALVMLLISASAAIGDNGSGFNQGRRGQGTIERLTVVNVESLGLVTFPDDYMFMDTPVGELSGITWDRNRGQYYVVADDRSEEADARYYTVEIDLSDGSLDDGDVVFTNVTTMLDEYGMPFELDTVDPEGIALASPGRLFISSEGGPGADPPTDPFVNRFETLDGEQNKAYPVPAKFLPDGDGTFGVRNNQGFESLTITPNRRHMFTGNENALAQDGPISSVDNEGMSRILRYTLNPGSPAEEFVYMVSAIPFPPDPSDAFADNGLVELAALDNKGTLIAMERSFAVGVGNTIRLYEISTVGATDVSGYDDLYDEDTMTPMPGIVPVSKRLIVDLEADLGLDPDNVEGMGWGPRLDDGSWSMILVSDNNFNPSQTMQFIALSMEVELAP